MEPINSFRVTRVYADANGDSRFEELFYPLHDGGPIGFLSEKVAVKELSFRKVVADYSDHHNAPERQFVVLLDGEVEIEITDGEKRVFKAGDVLQMEDTTGKGHISRNVKKAKRSSLFITF